MYRPLTDANTSLVALFARSEANGDGGDMGYLTIFYVTEQPVLLKVSGARQNMDLDNEGAAADGLDHAVRK